MITAVLKREGRLQNGTNEDKMGDLSDCNRGCV
jgi:hypothetical protein